MAVRDRHLGPGTSSKLPSHERSRFGPPVLRRRRWVSAIDLGSGSPEPEQWSDRAPHWRKSPGRQRSRRQPNGSVIRMIARQAAREFFSLVSDALDTRLSSGRADSGPAEIENRPENSARRKRTLVSSQRASSRASLQCLRLGVSQKTVRRKVSLGELHAQRVGRLLRVSERDLVGYLLITG